MPLAELGQWQTARVDQTIYHKNLRRVAYVFAETAGRPPADVVVDVLADRTETRPAAARRPSASAPAGWPRPRPGRSPSGRSSPTAAASGLGPAGRLHRGLRRRGRVEDHPGRVPRPRPGLRRRHDRHLRPAGRPDRLVRRPAGRHDGHPADDPGRHARLLAAQRCSAPNRWADTSIRSISRPRA